MKHFAVLLILIMSTVSARGGESSAVEKPDSPLAFSVKDMDGEDVNLAEKYSGKVSLIVNVASACSLKTQCEQMTKLHAAYADKGLVILAFPSTDFDEEPCTDEEFKTFWATICGAVFDVFARITVTGPSQAPLYTFLTSKEKSGVYGGEIRGSFTKFLIGRDGHVIGRFKPEVKPDAPEIVKAIESALVVDMDEWSDFKIGTISGQANL